MVCLVIEKGNSQDIGKTFFLRQGPVLIGRPTVENKPDIILHDEYVSRRHAELVYQQDHYELRDLNSTNGTSLDKLRLIPWEYYCLKDGSLIGIGNSSSGERVLLRFQESTVPIIDLNLVGNGPLKWLRINENAGEIWVDGKRFNLARKEYDLLLFLYNNTGKLCSRDELISRVWPEVIDPGGVSDAAVDQIIYRLRSKIESDPSRPRRLLTRKGFGFMLA